MHPIILQKISEIVAVEITETNEIQQFIGYFVKHSLRLLNVESLQIILIEHFTHCPRIYKPHGYCQMFTRNKFDRKYLSLRYNSAWQQDLPTYLAPHEISENCHLQNFRLYSTCYIINVSSVTSYAYA